MLPGQGTARSCHETIESDVGEAWGTCGSVRGLSVAHADVFRLEDGGVVGWQFVLYTRSGDKFWQQSSRLRASTRYLLRLISVACAPACCGLEY